MSVPDDMILGPHEFQGYARLFPLPDMVMFPHVLQPLHIFEDRYREMLEDALASDRLIAMGTLAPGWETDYDSRPRVQAMACLGRVATYHRLEDGRYNLLLVGLKRLRIIEELQPCRSYREARADICEDVYTGSCESQQQLQQRLLEQFKHVLCKRPEAHDPLEQVLGGELSLGMLTDIVAYTLNLGLSQKLQLLAQSDVEQRAKTLVSCLQLHRAGRRGSGQSRHPPDFSVN